MYFKIKKTLKLTNVLNIYQHKTLLRQRNLQKDSSNVFPKECEECLILDFSLDAFISEKKDYFVEFQI